MDPSRSRDALLGAGVTLLAFGFCLWRVIAETAGGADADPLRMTFYGLGMAASIVAHLAFVAVAARGQGRSALLWTVLALISFPVGSLAGMIVLLWFSDRPAQPPSQAQSQAPPRA